MTSGQKGPRVLELLEGAGQGLLSSTSWPPLCSCQRPSPLEKACGPGAAPCPGGVHQQETGLGALDAHGLQPRESQTSKEGAAGQSGFSMGGGAGRGTPPPEVWGGREPGQTQRQGLPSWNPKALGSAVCHGSPGWLPSGQVAKGPRVGPSHAGQG